MLYRSLSDLALRWSLFEGSFQLVIYQEWESLYHDYFLRYDKFVGLVLLSLQIICMDILVISEIRVTVQAQIRPNHFSHSCCDRISLIFRRVKIQIIDLACLPRIQVCVACKQGELFLGCQAYMPQSYTHRS